MIATLISLIPGLLGGNLAGMLLKKASLGLLGNSLVGLLGGGLGGNVLNSIGLLGSNEMVNATAGGGVGGGLLMLLVGFVRKMIAK